MTEFKEEKEGKKSVTMPQQHQIEREEVR